jgi:hypothetical protein
LRPTSHNRATRSRASGLRRGDRRESPTAAGGCSSALGLRARNVAVLAAGRALFRAGAQMPDITANAACVFGPLSMARR